MTTYTEPARPLEFLISEANGQLSREQVTIASGTAALVAGRVLGKITASQKYKAYDNTASDGSEVAAGVLAYDVDASAADKTVTAIVRLAEVKAGALGWGANDATGITAGTADLKAALVLTRAD